MGLSNQATTWQQMSRCKPAKPQWWKDLDVSLQLVEPQSTVELRQLYRADPKLSRLVHASSHRYHPGARVYTYRCNRHDWHQRWYFNTHWGRIKLHHGICLDTPHRNHNGGVV